MSDLKTEARATLVNSLQKRATTGLVAAAILGLEILPKTSKLYEDLKNLAMAMEYTPSYVMNQDYDRVDPIDTQLLTFAHFFDINIKQATEIKPYQKGYVETFETLLRKALTQLGVPANCSAQTALKDRHLMDFNDTTNSSKKGFVKKLRFLANFEQKIERFADVLNLRHAQIQSKSRLSYLINGDKLDDVSLAYVAYLAARGNRRSLFMLGGQSKSFDNISEGLKALIPADANWKEIAYVHPTTEMFARVKEEELGELVGLFHKEMVSASNHLSQLWGSLPQRMREEMVMVRGVDSSRWNAYAGAYNTMRSAWISASLFSKMGFLFNSYLPGKAPRLMAADIVWWGRNSGEKLHPDTAMFNELPYPWDVISGEEILTREDILAAGVKHGIEDILKTGWVGPRSEVETEVAEIEPITLHGVAISDPGLYKTLKEHNIFSGKLVKNPEKLTDDVLDKLVNRGVLPSKGNKFVPVVGATPAS